MISHADDSRPGWTVRLVGLARLVIRDAAKVADFSRRVSGAEMPSMGVGVLLVRREGRSQRFNALDGSLLLLVRDGMGCAASMLRGRGVLHSQSLSPSSSSTFFRRSLCRMLPPAFPSPFPSKSLSFFASLVSPCLIAPSPTKTASTSPTFVLSPPNSFSVTICLRISPAEYISTVGVFRSG